MAGEQLPLLFFKPSPAADPLPIAQAIATGSLPLDLTLLDSQAILLTLKSQRGFARLKITLPTFSLDNPRLNAAFEGVASETHILVQFLGDFEKLAKPLLEALVAQGLACYSIWDNALLRSWPKWQEPVIDKGFAARMSRVTERKERELREIENDPKRRTQMLDAFMKSSEFRAEMAKEAQLEPTGPRTEKTYSDLVNCYVRWKDGRPSALELAAVRKLDSKLAEMPIAELRKMIRNSPRFLVRTAAAPAEAAALRQSGEKQGLIVEVEPP